MDIASLVGAIKGYESECGAVPTGERSNVVKLLSGYNSKKIQFLVLRQTLEHPNEMVDPWGTSYQIEFSQQTNFVIRSAGKDKIFGDADDIVYNSASNSIVKP